MSGTLRKEGLNLSVTKDTTGKWMSQIRIKDYSGKTIHKKKRGFATKKEALEWERDFLNKANADMGMLFQDLKKFSRSLVKYRSTGSHLTISGSGRIL